MEEALELVCESFVHNRDATSNRREAFKLYYRNFRQIYDDEEDGQFTNNYFDPITMETVATYRPFICSRPPNLKHRPREVNDIAAADRIRSWQDYQWYCQRMREKRQQLSWFTAVFGTGVLYHFYRKETERQKYKIFANEKVEWKEREVNKYDDPDCEVVDVVNDWFPDDYGTTVDLCRNIVHRQYVHIDEIKRLQEGRDPWLTESVSTDEILKCTSSSDYTDKRYNWERYGDSKLQDLLKLGIVELLNYWENDRLVIVANRMFVLRDTPNPYHVKKKPYTVFVDEDNPAEIWGIGEAEILVKTQHVLNTVGRMHIDAAKRQLRQIFIAPTGSNLDPGALYDEENYVAETPFARDVNPLPPPVMANAGLPTVAEIRYSADRATGFTPLFKGMSGQGADTATEKRLEQGNMMARAFYKLGQFDQGFASWMTWNVGLALQYYPETKYFRIVNKSGVEWKQLNYQDLLAGVDVEIESRSSQPISIDEKTLQADSLLAVYSQNQFIKQRELTQMTLELKEIPDYERLLKTEQEVQQEMAEQMQAAQQQQEDLYEKELSKEIMKGMMAEPTTQDQVPQ